MPRQYEHIRDAYIDKGVSEKEAKKRAAMTYNSLHKGHPMHPGTHHASGGTVKKHKSSGLPPQLAGAAAGLPPPGGAPMGPGNVPPPGMKKGGSIEISRKHNPIAGEAKDAHGKRVAMKHGGKTHSRGGGIAKRGFSSGGSVTRGDGIAERGHTKGTCR
jgi:hypothetical protein